jgi:2-polyprenyl-3-methyl-5-hydroxy-6-metoxy-1,4-benzoquinol methylase
MSTSTKSYDATSGWGRKQLLEWERGCIDISKKVPSNREVVAQILHILGDLRGKRTLEVGAGSGADSVYLAKKGAEAHCLDYSRTSVNSIKELSEREGVKLFNYNMGEISMMVSGWGTRALK